MKSKHLAILISIIFSILLQIPQAYGESCVSTHFDENATIDYVIDGDTVVLSDKRHIRLIGINTPEINHKDKRLSDQGAEQAKSKLEALLQPQTPVQLVYGQERFDKHGRTLAHIFLGNELNVQAEMLRDGLAMPLRIGPNLSLADCYHAVSIESKKQNQGLWALPIYETKHVRSLNGSERGFYFISGRVERVTESRSSIWLNLENNVALRVHKDNLQYFNKNDLMSLKGKVIEANGWLYKRNKQLRIEIRHRLDIKTLH